MSRCCTPARFETTLGAPTALRESTGAARFDLDYMPPLTTTESWSETNE
jgi:hypothetical protein